MSESDRERCEGVQCWITSSDLSVAAGERGEGFHCSFAVSVVPTASEGVSAPFAPSNPGHESSDKQKR